MTCKINADTSNGLVLESDTSGEIDLQIDGATKVHMASDAKVGIGTTSPAHMLHIISSDARVRTEESGGSTTFDITNTSSGHFIDSSGSNDLTINKQGGADMIFKTNNTEAHRIDSFRQFLFGGITSELTGNGGCLQLKSRTGSEHCATFRNGTSDGGFGINFQDTGGTERGSIRWTNTATNFNTTSDYRLKENVSYSWTATTELKKLKPCKFNFTGSSDTVEGFLAHEVSDVVPVAVLGTKDETRDLGTIKDADGNVIRENVIESSKESGQTWAKTSTENVYQSIDQSKLVPLLVKTIQELEARITALESE